MLQMGGSDQWGNIVAGVDLIRRVEASEAFALVCPLLTTASGQKMGKTEGNSVWLDPNLTSPYDYYQFWINSEDADVARFLRLYTFLPDEEIDALTTVEGAALRDAKRVLAREATAMTHRETAAEEAEAAATRLFATNVATGALLDDPTLPTTVLSRAAVEAGLTIADLFIAAGLAMSRGDARRTAQQGGLSIGDDRVDDVDQPFLATKSAVLLRFGKKKFRRVVVK